MNQNVFDELNRQKIEMRKKTKKAKYEHKKRRKKKEKYGNKKTEF